MSIHSSDWVSAFPEDDEVPPRVLPKPRPRTRRLIAGPPGEGTGEPAPPSSPIPDVKEKVIKPLDVPEANTQKNGAEVYEVGYGKPPAHARFKPGQSGNPKGRPKGAKGLNTIVRETLGSKVSVRTANGTKRISKIEAVLQKTLEKALKGDPRAQLELIKLWKNAVPEQANCDSAGDETEGLTAGDLAILQAFRADIATAGDAPCA